ncbi:hypothetical protein QBC44DRAFT_143651 [Cladorrhinum sp. PSN332]|nr:hypothetical protein QBC44DRAFT_143651 [Cladorrhinum sp. PSN332]
MVLLSIADMLHMFPVVALSVILPRIPLNLDVHANRGLFCSSRKGCLFFRWEATVVLSCTTARCNQPQNSFERQQEEKKTRPISKNLLLGSPLFCAAVTQMSRMELCR